MIVSCHQPNYLPWPGFFHKILKSDVHVILDTNQLPRGKDFVVRNKIKIDDDFKWLRVGVLEKNKMLPIKEVKINNSINWKEKHWNSISNNYSKAPFFSEYKKQFQQIFKKQWDYLLDFNMEIIYAIMKILQIKVKIVMESELGIKSSSTQEILDILDTLNSKQYLTGNGSGSKRIIEGKENMFSERGIQIIYENYVPPQYPQIRGKFIPELSICDMLFNVGMKRTREILNRKNKRLIP
jgi:hypothetical protein|tara:strand:+ start:248 stop:964 length:717 start_codon:yes stop_codon:yes gene_type:complete